jgi:hypothetical protein
VRARLPRNVIVASPSCCATSDVRRCRRGQDGRAGRQRQQVPRQSLVVGSEVETPVADAVCFVDDHHARGGEQLREAGCEPRVSQTLRRHQQHVELARVHLSQHAVPLVDVGRVDGCSGQPGTRGSRHLIAHQRQQGRHHESQSRAAGSQRRRGCPVDGRFAPSGCLHNEHPPPVDHQRPHGFDLIGPSIGVGPGQCVQHVGQVRVGHFGRCAS